MAGDVTILNVDDYVPGRYARTRVLRDAGYRVVEAGTGAEALRLLEREKPQLVVLDVNLPDMSGFDVCRRIKNDPATAHTVVLHMSASSIGLESRLRGLGSGGDSYLTEPVDPEELVANVAALLRLRIAEHALRDAHATLSTVIDASPLALVALDGGSLVQMWSPAAERMFGWSRQDTLGRPCPSIPRELAEQYEGRLTPARGGAAFTGFETEGVRRDGSRVEVSVSASPLAGSQENGLLLIFEDITRRKAAERQAARLFHETQLANRAKDDFLAVLSHELRTPLNAMLGWVRMLRRDELPADRVPHALEVVERNAIAQVRLIEDILDMSRIVSGKLQVSVSAVDLAHVARLALEGVQPQADAKRIAVTAEFPTAPIVVAGDPQRLQQIVLNLVSNAVKFTPEGGSVRLAVESAAGEARVTVEDSGSGIDPAFLPHVFERFRQANTSATRQHGGLGLGLAIVRHLVEAHGGTVTARSAGPGRGSTFIVTLPLATAAHDDAALREYPSTSRDLEGTRILIVDDHEDSREMTTALLAAHGASVCGAASVGAAAAAITAFQPDVILADLAMPVQDGFALLAQLRESREPSIERTPVIAVSGYATVEDRAQTAAAGFAAHIAKPINAPELIAEILGVLGR